MTSTSTTQRGIQRDSCGLDGLALGLCGHAVGLGLLGAVDSGQLADVLGEDVLELEGALLWVAGLVVRVIDVCDAEPVKELALLGLSLGKSGKSCLVR
jgi:hypothetical protein